MRNRMIRRVLRMLFLLAGMACVLVCCRMVSGKPVEYPQIWIAGLILFLLWIVIQLSRMNACERYTMKKFEDRWIIDRNAKKGLMYQDKPGCYVILIYRHPRFLPITAGYTNVYVGQSLGVYHRIHNHLNRKGNGDVYADARDGKHIEIEVYPCRKEQMNDLEIRLIRKYDAEEYYNRTAGGGTRR